MDILTIVVNYVLRVAWQLSPSVARVERITIKANAFQSNILRANVRNGFQQVPMKLERLKQQLMMVIKALSSCSAVQKKPEKET